MAFSSSIKNQINYLLKIFNLKIETLTLEKIESNRLDLLKKQALLNKPIFLTPECFKSNHYQEILKSVISYSSDLSKFNEPSANRVAYSYDNGYFTSPDTEVLYTIVRKYKPKTVIEIGCGNSTKIIRQAIWDEDLQTKLISIDPKPRLDIKEYPDKIYFQPVESLSDEAIFDELKSGDILFIDSSHLIKTGNDVVFLYTNILPRLCSGVIIHIHDIFLPYEYPQDWVIKEKYNFNEQYLVHCILTMGNAFEVLWAGYFLQQTKEDFASYFPHLDKQTAQSLWIKKY